MSKTAMPTDANGRPLPISRPAVAQAVTTTASAGVSAGFTHTTIRCRPSADVFFKVGPAGTTATTSDHFMPGEMLYPEIPVKEGEVIAFALASGDATIYISELI